MTSNGYDFSNSISYIIDRLIDNPNIEASELGLSEETLKQIKRSRVFRMLINSSIPNDEK